MRVLITIICLAVVGFGSCELRAQWPQTTSPCHGNHWFEAGVKILDRPGSDLAFPIISNGVTNDILLDAEMLSDMNTSAGVDIRYGRRGPSGLEWEFVSSLGGWDSDFAFVGPNLESVFQPGFSPDNVILDYTSDFYNFELNFRRAVWPGMTFLAGPRYMNFQEELQLLTDTLISTPLGDFNFETDNVLATRNSMIGGQIGLEFNQPLTQGIFLQGFVKAAGMNNHTKVFRTAETTIDALTSSRATKSTGTFIGQAGGRIYGYIIPNHVATYAGYEATWIDGVALGPTQFFNTNGPTVVTDNTLFWHAVTFGVNFTF